MKKKNNGKLRIIPLGGLEQIGMNITAFEYEDSIVVVDCGLAFPEDDMLGIDLVIPDVTYLKDNISKVKGFVITHGHEDHIGALPYVLKEINIPIYTTKLTMGIIENKLKEHNLLRSTRRKVVRHGQSINLGKFRIEFIKTNHSIQDASALAIYSPAGVVVHTGDFKVDYTPVFGDAIDLQRFAEIGKKGVLALMENVTDMLIRVELDDTVEDEESDKCGKTYHIYGYTILGPIVRCSDGKLQIEDDWDGIVFYISGTMGNVREKVEKDINEEVDKIMRDAPTRYVVAFDGSGKVEQIK